MFSLSTEVHLSNLINASRSSCCFLYLHVQVICYSNAPLLLIVTSSNEAGEAERKTNVTADALFDLIASCEVNRAQTVGICLYFPNFLGLKPHIRLYRASYLINLFSLLICHLLVII